MGVAAAQVHGGMTLAANPYFIERGDVLRTAVDGLGEIAVPGEIPKRRHERDPVVPRASHGPGSQCPEMNQAKTNRSA